MLFKNSWLVVYCTLYTLDYNSVSRRLELVVLQFVSTFESCKLLLMHRSSHFPKALPLSRSDEFDEKRVHTPLTNTSVKHLSAPLTHSYAASSARLHLLMVRVRMFPLDSMMYLPHKDTVKSHEHVMLPYIIKHDRNRGHEISLGLHAFIALWGFV